jgi:hypothetical protein
MTSEDYYGTASMRLLQFCRRQKKKLEEFPHKVDNVSEGLSQGYGEAEEFSEVWNQLSETAQGESYESQQFEELWNQIAVKDSSREATAINQLHNKLAPEYKNFVKSASQYLSRSNK